MTTPSARSAISRRRALGGVASAGLGLPLLAACGDDGGGAEANDPVSGSPTTSRPTSDAPSAQRSGSGGPSATPPAGGIPVSDVPVGGGIVTDDAVLTQPTAGEFKAFTNVCTHQQCLVTEVTDGTIHCPCHGSRFSVADGSVTGGPAPSPLGEITVTVEGDHLVLG